MNIIADEGYFFGMGVFETIDVYNGYCLLLGEHLSRLNKSLSYFEINKTILEADVLNYLDQNPLKSGVLKITVSCENTVFSTRSNPYSPDQYEKGFKLCFTEVLRNETSPFTYHKTLNCGDNINEKRKALKNGFDEAIFLNTKGEICEGTATNIFFLKKDGIFTPTKNSGLLNGVIRQYLLKRYDVSEMIITPRCIEKFDECFITNSLMGIMPVTTLHDFKFTTHEKTHKLLEEYLAFKEGHLTPSLK